jgi:hypothetical protein
VTTPPSLCCKHAESHRGAAVEAAHLRGGNQKVCRAPPRRRRGCAAPPPWRVCERGRGGGRDPKPEPLIPTPYSPHPEPFTRTPPKTFLYPTSHARNPAPCALHPKPETLNPKPKPGDRSAEPRAVGGGDGRDRQPEERG